MYARNNSGEQEAKTTLYSSSPHQCFVSPGVCDAHIVRSLVPNDIFHAAISGGLLRVDGERMQ